MKLVVISHPCVTPINQQFFAQVQSRSGWDVTVVLPARWRSEYGTRTAARWPQFQGRLLTFPVLLSGNIPLHVYRARFDRILAIEQPDAIYVHHEPYGTATFQVFVAASRIRGVRLGFYSAQNLVKRLPWPFGALERYVFRHANFAVAVSEAVEHVLRLKGYDGPASVLPLAVDTRLFQPNPNHTRLAPAEQITVGFVGRLTVEKGIDTLLEALACRPSDRVHAVVVGDGPEAGALKRRSQALGLGARVTWAGYIAHDAMPGMYRQMDLVVVPSVTTRRWKEQFGRVVLESLACGVPVLTSDSGELPQLVALTGGGWTFPEGDAAALASIIDDLVGNPQALRERGQIGRSVVDQRFGVGTLAGRFAQIVSPATVPAA